MGSVKGRNIKYAGGLHLIWKYIQYCTQAIVMAYAFCTVVYILKMMISGKGLNVFLCASL